MPRIYWSDFKKEHEHELYTFCPKDTFNLVPRQESPSIISPALLNKFDSILYISSGTSQDLTYFGGIGNRVDGDEIDQHPFMIAFSGTIAFPKICILEHGDWPGRTIQQPSGFEDYLECEGIGNIFQLPDMPQKNRGYIEELHNTSFIAGFHATAEYYKTYIEQYIKQNPKK